MAAVWYWKTEDQEVRGPLAAADLKQLARLGTLLQQSLVRKGSDGKWVTAGKVQGLFTSNTPAASPPVSPPDDVEPVPPQLKKLNLDHAWPPGMRAPPATTAPQPSGAGQSSARPATPALARPAAAQPSPVQPAPAPAQPVITPAPHPVTTQSAAAVPGLQPTVPAAATAPGTSASSTAAASPQPIAPAAPRPLSVGTPRPAAVLQQAAPSTLQPAPMVMPGPGPSPAGPVVPQPFAPQPFPQPTVTQPVVSPSTLGAFPTQAGTPGMAMTSMPQVSPKSKVTAALLAILPIVGVFAAHDFYLGKTNRALIKLAIVLLTCFMGSAITAVWGFIDGILILTGSGVDSEGRPLK